jgi:hypothetical protein
VSTVGTSAALGSLVDLDVLDNEVAGVKALGVGVGLGVLQKVKEELGGLNGPAGTGNTPLLSWNTVSIIPSQTPLSDPDVLQICHGSPCDEFSALDRIAASFWSNHRLEYRGNALTLSAAASGAGESPERNDLGLGLNVLKEGKGTLQLHAVDGLGGLAGVLEADTQVRAPSAGALSGRDILSSVTDLIDKTHQHSSPTDFLDSKHNS